MSARDSSPKCTGILETNTEKHPPIFYINKHRKVDGLIITRIFTGSLSNCSKAHISLPMALNTGHLLFKCIWMDYGIIRHIIRTNIKKIYSIYTNQTFMPENSTMWGHRNTYVKEQNIERFHSYNFKDWKGTFCSSQCGQTSVIQPWLQTM